MGKRVSQHQRETFGTIGHLSANLLLSSSTQILKFTSANFSSSIFLFAPQCILYLVALSYRPMTFGLRLSVLMQIRHKWQLNVLNGDVSDHSSYSTFFHKITIAVINNHDIIISIHCIIRVWCSAKINCLYNHTSHCLLFLHLMIGQVVTQRWEETCFHT